MSRLSLAIRRLKQSLRPAETALPRLREACRLADSPTSVLILTHHKCATTFITRMLQHLESQPGPLRCVDYEDLLWNHGAALAVNARCGGPSQLLETMRNHLFSERGFVYGPLRSGCSIGYDDRFKRLFILRDPRDSLVSRFFSITHSHAQPVDPAVLRLFRHERSLARQECIDDYVLRAATTWLQPLLASYRGMIVDSTRNVRVVHYEDLVDDPLTVVHDMLTYITGVEPHRDAVTRLLVNETFVQQTEAVGRHQRSGRPDQYHERLRPETIDRLDDILREELAFFWPHATARAAPIPPVSVRLRSAA
jgi:hypothetical protein